MTDYNCVQCQFYSMNKKDYTRHMKTKKHLKKVKQTHISEFIAPQSHLKSPHEKEYEEINEKIQINEKVYICNSCKNTFTRASSLTKHKKICIDLSIKETEKEQEFKNKEIEILKKQLQTYETLLKSMTTPQTVNYFNFICQNYPDTPALKCQKSYHNIIDAKTMTLIEVVTMYYYDNKLVSFIGDYIIKLYKKEKPDKQSLWSTDISRLTYIISECCSKTKENIWSYDKKGAKIKKIIIEPALNYLRNNLVKFCKNNSGDTDFHIMKQLMAATATIQLIDDGNLADKVNRYIAPEFAIKQPEDISVTVKLLN